MSQTGQESCYLVDSHCHLHDQEWFSREQVPEILQHASANRVDKIICIGTDPDDSWHAADFAAEHEGIYWTYGIHPEGAERYTMKPDDFDHLRTETTRADSRLVAIGEIGLDYHYEPYSRDQQIHLFETMLQLAQDLQLPVSLHIREAFDDALAVLDNFPKITGVVHSFTASKKILKKILDRDFYVGVNGLATYSTLPLPPIEKMLLETDAPFLTPVPYRGTMNKPGYIRDIAAYLADKMGVAENIIAEQTTNNAHRLFHI